jgi:hypothetical protein
MCLMSILKQDVLDVNLEQDVLDVYPEEGCA